MIQWQKRLQSLSEIILEILLEYVEKPFQENAFFANKDVKFALATLGNDAGICGAAKLVLDDFAE